MNVFHNASWLSAFNYDYTDVDSIPSSVFEKINQDLDLVQSENPLVSIVIAAWNEEINILRCIASLAKTKSRIPFEIIVVNNNSTDDTQSILNKLHIRSFFERMQGCGPARQKGQENARGKYILLADADCLYPAVWMEEMMKVLQKPGVVCVYGRYSFISEKGYPRWKLFILEKMKDVIAEIRHINQPYFNAFGISMGYVKEFGLKEGFIKNNRRGEDGQLCLDLMKYGKVKQMRCNKARAWTAPRTLKGNGNFSDVLKYRVLKELKRFMRNINSHKPDNSNEPKFSKK
jgi:glycosyltransferase involved in cell wall biosynthesis